MGLAPVLDALVHELDAAGPPEPVSDALDRIPDDEASVGEDEAAAMEGDAISDGVEAE